MPNVYYSDFSGGVDTRQSSIVIANDSAGAVICENANNLYLTDAGLRAMGGYYSLLTTLMGAEPEGLFTWNGANGQELIACGNGKVYRVNGVTLTQLYTGATAGGFYTACYYANNLVMCNGLDLPLVYNGTTVTVPTLTDPKSIWGTTKPQYCDSYGGRIFYGWTANDTSRVWTPVAGTFLDFGNDGSGNPKPYDTFPIDGAGEITGLKAYANKILAVYKTSSIRAISGTTPADGTNPFFKFVVQDAIGCISPRSLVAINNAHWFLSSGGVIKIEPTQTQAGTSASTVTYPIRDYFKTINNTRSVLNKNVAVYDEKNGQYILVLANANVNTAKTWLEIDTITGANQFRNELAQVSCFTYFNNNVVHADATGQIYNHFNTTTANNVVFPLLWESKFIAHGSLLQGKKYKSLAIVADVQSQGVLLVEITLQGDYNNQTFSYPLNMGMNNANSLWGTAIWGTSIWSGYKGTIAPLNGIGSAKAIKIKLTSTQGLRLNITGIELNYSYIGDRAS